MVTERLFGTVSGQDVHLMTLADASGAEVELISLGAAIRAIRVPDRNGTSTDICLGYETPEEYASRDACFGGTIGRCANRIGGARFTIGGREYRVTPNEGRNTLHGGAVGFHQKLWTHTCGRDSVTFSLTSPDGDEGFPGNLHVEATYTLLDGTLTISYRAESDADTVVNLTNHAYFNLSGHGSGPVTDHVLTVLADRYTPSDSGNIPTGALVPVDGTPLDLRTPTVLGKRLRDPFLAGSRGYDHNFVLNSGGPWAAELYCPRTGIALEVSTTLEGMQLYTAGWLTERPGKGGVRYAPAHAVCLETQHFPDAVNHESFPSPILRAGAVYHQVTKYRFFVKP